MIDFLNRVKKNFFRYSCSLMLFISCSHDMGLKRDFDYNEYKKSYENSNWLQRKDILLRASRYSSSNTTRLLLLAIDDKHPEVQSDALLHLGKYLPPEAKEKVRELARHAKNDNIRWYALLVLARYQDPKSASIFIYGIRDKDWLIREASIKGLLRIDDRETQYKSIPVIIKSLRDQRINVKLAALEMLRIRDKKLYAVISVMLHQNIKRENNTMIQATLKALNGYIIDKKTRKKLINLLVHPNKDIRVYAFRVLKREKELKDLMNKDE